MFMQPTSQSVALHGAFAHLAADHKGAATAHVRMEAEFRTEQAPFGLHHPQHQQGGVMATTAAVQAVEAPVSPETHRCWECHEPRCRTGASDREPGTTSFSAGADHATACVGAHADAETRHPLAFAACSSQGSLGHLSGLASCRSELVNLSVSPCRSASSPRSRTWERRRGPESGRSADTSACLRG